METSISLIERIMQLLQNQSSIAQWVLFAIMGAIFVYFIWATIKNCINFIFGVIGVILSVIASFFLWKQSDTIAYFLSPEPASWLYWTIPALAPIIVFIVIIKIKNRIIYTINQSDELARERRRKNHQLTKKDKEEYAKPKKSFFKQLFTTLFLSIVFTSCLLLYLTITGKSTFLQDWLPKPVSNLSSLSDINVSGLSNLAAKAGKFKDIQEFSVLSQFILLEAQAPKSLQQIISAEDYQTIMQIPIGDWLNEDSFKKAAAKGNNTELLLKIFKKMPDLTPEIKKALANFELSSQDYFEK